MENRKLIKFLIPILILGFFVVNISYVFAYSIDTHAYLTSEIIKFYNQNFSNNKISDELKSYFLDGSRKEDDVPRWMNHFYDPIYNRGLADSILGTWQKSKDWAQDSNNQNSLTYKVPATIASVLTAIQQQKINAISVETDFTWQRAIKFYAQGDKEKAMFMLGHILHLIEDASVPDHTRNDPHPGDSPYENYTSQFNLTNPDKTLNNRLTNKTQIVLTNLNSYFDELANYSNNGFYSKDRIGIQTGYKLPEPNYFDKDGIYFYGFKADKENSDYHLLVYKKPPSKYLWAFNEEVTLKDEGQDFIVFDYWSRLSTKSVQYGAGVINLFFQEVEAAKNDPNFAKAEEKSIFARAFEATKNLFAQVGNFFSGIFGAGQDFQEVGQVTLEQSSDAQPSQAEKQSPKSEVQTSPKTVIESPKVNQQNQPQENQLAETEEDKEVPQQEEIQQATTTLLQTTSTLPQTANFKQCSFQTNQSPSRQKVLINEVAWMGTAASANDEWIELKNISNTEVDLNGWQLIDQGEQIKINLASINGSKIIKSGQFVLLERTDDNSVPGITADLTYSGILSNSNEGLRLFDNQCNLIDEVLANPKWPAGDNSNKQTMEQDSNGFGWHTSSIVEGTPKRENSTPAVVYSGGGGTPANNQQQTATEIKITEIMYNPEGNDSGREWIEIFNAGASAVNLEGWKFYEDGTNHTLGLVRGLISLAPGGYAVIADDGNKFLQDYPQYTGTLFDSSFSLNNTGEVIAIKNGDLIVDQVNYQSSWGENDNGKSLQLINNEWKEGLSTPGQQNQISSNNQSPSAFFVYSPSNPQVGDLITFNAASSSDSDGQITFYQWNFGDNATSSITTAITTYSYSQAGNYSASLIVFDNQNASSTATSTAISVASASANHLVISEIMTGNGTNHSEEEFVELYNPTNQVINLNGWALKRKSSQNSTSTSYLVSNFSTTSTIPAKGFFLVAHQDYSNYSTSTQPDFFYTNNSNPLAYDDDVVILYNDADEIVDEVYYQDIGAGETLERKAFYNGQCITASGSGEFLGNSCDTNSTTDFEISNTPKPQNSQSLPEPRNAPTTPQNFSVQYNSSTMELVFDWSSSQDYSGATSTITYKITDISNASSTLSIIETASTTAKISINEIGRQYNSSIQALDQEGLGSATSTSSSTVPSFFSSLYSYQDPRDNTKNLIETYYSQYPFVSDLYYGSSNSSWKLLVFYLNNDADKQSDIDAIPYQPNNLEKVLAIKYKHCSGGSITKENSLLLPDIASRCGTEGDAQNIGFAFSELEDNHFIIQVASSSQELTFNNNDFITIAFYSSYSIGVGPIPHFRLVAVDKTKYYFGNSPTHQPPQLTGSINLNFDRQNSQLYIDWPKATDSDTLDNLLTYEIQCATSTGWESLNTATGTQKIVAPGDNFSISVRAKDDFNNYSNILTGAWSYPETQFYINQVEFNNWSNLFGIKNENCPSCPDSASLQSITPQENIQFNKVVLRLRQGNDAGEQINDFANIRLSVYKDNNDQPNFNDKVSESTISGLFDPDENQDLAFNFNSPIPLEKENKYWLVLNISNYNWNQSVRNIWRNAINSLADNYSYGVAGWAESAFCDVNYENCRFRIPYPDSNADWYMKIGLE